MATVFMQKEKTGLNLIKYDLKKRMTHFTFLINHLNLLNLYTIQAIQIIINVLFWLNYYIYILLTGFSE